MSPHDYLLNLFLTTYVRSKKISSQRTHDLSYSRPGLELTTTKQQSIFQILCLD